MEQFIFEIATEKQVEKRWSIDIARKYPVHEDYLLEQHIKTVVYKFKPTKGLDKPDYIEYLKKYLTKEYSSSSVVCLNHNNQV